MELLEQFKQRVQGKGFGVVLPEGSDERIIQAARQLVDEDIAKPTLLGNVDEIKKNAADAGVSLEGIILIDPKKSDKQEDYAQAYCKQRKNVKITVAGRMMKKALFYGGMMVACGDADTMVGGVVSATAMVIQAGALTVGFGQGIKTPSSFFLMIIPEYAGVTNKCFIYADCAVNIDPTGEELAEIALASAMSGAKLLGEEPKVAMLSFSTKGSASHEHVNKVTQALSIAKERNSALAIDGEFQADSAIVERVAAKKVKEPSRVAGQANVLIFPDLNSGNIAYKLTQYLAKAQAIGPFLQGFARPISDLSRGASVDDIVNTTAITLNQL